MFDLSSVTGHSGHSGQSELSQNKTFFSFVWRETKRSTLLSVQLCYFQFCNLFETGSASEWLMYISEWEAPGGGLPLSNIRVTTKVAVNALLGDTPTLVNYGSALMANLGDKEVKAVVCILQFIVPNFSFNKYSLLNIFL